MSLRKFVENVLSYRSNYAGKVYKIGHICEGMI